MNFFNIIVRSDQKSSLIETGDAKQVLKKFIVFLKSKTYKRYSRNRSKGAIFAVPYNRTLRDQFKKPVYKNGIKAGLMNCQNY